MLTYLSIIQLNDAGVLSIMINHSILWWCKIDMLRQIFIEMLILSPLISVLDEKSVADQNT